VPNIQKRLTNNLNWLDVMSNEESKFPNGFQGIVITGWSRYDHFAVLAELLPASMPSLATNLISVSHGYFNASWQKELYQVPFIYYVSTIWGFLDFFLPYVSIFYVLKIRKNYHLL
jgi:hypothetical protein